MGKNGYTSFTQSAFLGNTQKNIGKWQDVKIMSIEIGYYNHGGIIVSEKADETNNITNNLKQSITNAFGGKYKYIRTENL